MKWFNNNILFLVILIIGIPSLFYGQTESSPHPADKSAAIQYDRAIESIGKDLETLETELDLEKKLRDDKTGQQQIYRTQINSLRNFLIVPGISISVFEKGIEEIDISLSVIKAKIQKLSERNKKLELTLSSVEDKLFFIKQSISDLEQFKGKPASKESELKALKPYRSNLEKQQKIITDTMDLLSQEMTVLNDLIQSFEDIRVTLKKEIKQKKETLLFEKNEITLKSFSPGEFKKEIQFLFTTTRQLVSINYISMKASLLKEYMDLKSIITLFAFFMFSIFFYQGWSLLRNTKSYKEISSKSLGNPLTVIKSSLLLVFGILFLVTLSMTRLYVVFPDLIKFMISFAVVMFLTKIASHSIRLIVQEKETAFLKRLYQWRNKIVWGIRIHSLVYLFIYRFLSSDNTLLLTAVRIVSETILVAGVFLFWRAFKQTDDTRSPWMKLVIILSEIIALSGLLADISGYGYFAVWWYISWGFSSVIFILCLMTLSSMKEVDLKFKQKFKPESPKSYSISYPFYWILSNGLYFLVIILALTGLAFSWSISDKFFEWLWEVFNRKYVIGKIELSLAGLTYSFLVIFLTYLLTQLWKKIISEYILKDSGLTTGAKDSVITISVYIIWSIGILISLSVFGLNTTSITVAIGALSIGLGFGLQNIFNNFISGLILLFERPIQVGDIVEVGGIWGEVKKINVRSTLVQTYENSSLIIPNSEFISANVTNWSHKDPYIRRDVKVGVAYGSDTDLVGKLLLQAAHSVDEVYNYPKKPVVHFIDFGDSSLDFRLRFWSTIDNFILAESKLRFKIDKLFNENHVVIPFPQRDVHISGGSK